MWAPQCGLLNVAALCVAQCVITRCVAHVPAGVETSSLRKLQLVAAHQHGAAALGRQQLHDKQVVIGLDSVANDGVEAIKCRLVCGKVGFNLGLAVVGYGGNEQHTLPNSPMRKSPVQVKGAFWNLGADIIHTHGIAVQIAIRAGVETRARARSEAAVTHSGLSCHGTDHNSASVASWSTLSRAPRFDPPSYVDLNLHDIPWLLRMARLRQRGGQA